MVPQSLGTSSHVLAHTLGYILFRSAASHSTKKKSDKVVATVSQCPSIFIIVNSSQKYPRTR
jgi:hypothetical protein